LSPSACPPPDRRDGDAFHALGHDQQLALLRQVAGAALDRHGIVGASIEPLQYERNAVFAIRRGDLRCALRIGPVDGPDRAALLDELDWLTALDRDTGLAVPVPMANLDGDVITTVGIDGMVGPRPCILLRWVDGERAHPVLSAATARRIGAVMARLHVHAAGLPPSALAARAPWGRARLGLDAAAIAAVDHDGLAADELALVEGAVTRIDHELSAIGDRPAVWGPIHGDLHLDNLLVDGDRVGVIDFDDCGRGHYGYDLAVVLDAIRRRIADSDREYAALRSELLAGYTELRSLPATLDAELVTFRAVREIATLAFIVGATNAEIRMWAPARIVEILANLARYLDGAGRL
jgi:Ser/Thr protein kinase RdoA (MazF antagonist)